MDINNATVNHRTAFTDIIEFHRKFGFEPVDSPDHKLPHDLQLFRIKFMEEELREYREAVEAGDMAKAMDALIDLEYVLLGTAYIHNFQHDEGWRRVHRANMAKVRALRASESLRGSTYDVVKPPGWTPPVLEDLL